MLYRSEYAQHSIRDVSRYTFFSRFYLTNNQPGEFLFFRGEPFAALYFQTVYGSLLEVYLNQVASRIRFSPIVSRSLLRVRYGKGYPKRFPQLFAPLPLATLPPTLSELPTNRVITGQNMFVTDYVNSGNVNSKVGLGTDVPSKIVRLPLAAYGGEVICQRGAFLAGSHTIDIQVLMYLCMYIQRMIFVIRQRVSSFCHRANIVFFFSFLFVGSIPRPVRDASFIAGMICNSHARALDAVPLAGRCSRWPAWPVVVRAADGVHEDDGGLLWR